MQHLDIRSYGISVTTLEEVFLRVGHGDDTSEDLKIKEELKNKREEAEKVEDDFSIAENAVSGACNIFGIHMIALFLKRFFIYRRNYKGLVIEILIPVLLVLIGFGFSKV